MPVISPSSVGMVPGVGLGTHAGLPRMRACGPETSQSLRKNAYVVRDSLPISVGIVPLEVQVMSVDISGGTIPEKRLVPMSICCANPVNSPNSDGTPPDEMVQILSLPRCVRMQTTKAVPFEPDPVRDQS